MTELLVLRFLVFMWQLKTLNHFDQLHEWGMGIGFVLYRFTLSVYMVKQVTQSLFQHINKQELMEFSQYANIKTKIKSNSISFSTLSSTCDVYLCVTL